MSAELWLFFTGLAHSPDPSDRESCIFLETVEKDLPTLITKIPVELLAPENKILIRYFPKRIEVEIQV